MPRPPADRGAGDTQRELRAWALLVALALALRLADLGSRPFHHDESQVAYFVASYLHDHNYRYDPLLHGPWMYMTGAATAAIAGVSDFSVRLAPALMGTVVVALPFFARRELGRVAAFAAAVTLTISPAMLYYSRFDREDIHIAALTLAVVVVAARFLVDPRPWQPIVAGLLLAGTLTVKESALFFGALGALFILAVLSSARVRAPLERFRRGPGWPPRGRSPRCTCCCSRRSVRIRRESGTASTRGRATGSASTASGAAASRGSTTGCC